MTRDVDCSSMTVLTDNGIFIVQAKWLQMLMFRRGAVQVLAILGHADRRRCSWCCFIAVGVGK